MFQRYKTWEEECLPRMDIRGNGPVALCVLWNLLETVIKRLPEGTPDLGAIGNLRTPFGIGWFVRGLYQLPHIKRVVIWGQDLTRTADGLLALWKHGVAKGHTVPELGWALDELIPADAIDYLRQEVELVDLRKQPPESIVKMLKYGHDCSPSRFKQNFPPAIVPERQFWSARGTAIHMEAPNLIQGWLGALSVIVRCGIPMDTRKKEKLAHFFDVIVSFPVLERKRSIRASTLPKRISITMLPRSSHRTNPKESTTGTVSASRTGADTISSRR